MIDFSRAKLAVEELGKLKLLDPSLPIPCDDEITLKKLSSVRKDRAWEYAQELWYQYREKPIMFGTESVVPALRDCQAVAFVCMAQRVSASGTIYEAENLLRGMAISEPIYEAITAAKDLIRFDGLTEEEFFAKFNREDEDPKENSGSASTSG